MPAGPDLLSRTEAFASMRGERLSAGLWPHGRTLDFGPFSEVSLLDGKGREEEGVNMASKDPLGLSVHPAVKDAAFHAVRHVGTHAAGSAFGLGTLDVTAHLERKLAVSFEAPEALLFPSGWSAAFGVVQALVNPDDHVLVDAACDAPFHQGAHAATRNVGLLRHRDRHHARRMLSAIRATDVRCGILLVTQSSFLYPGDGGVDLASWQDLASEFGATLLVGTFHDFGIVGSDGLGHVAQQGVVGKLDMVVGTFANALATNGGFLVARRRGVADFVRTFSTAVSGSSSMSPVQVAVADTALSISASMEGGTLRARLASNIVALKGHLEDARVGADATPSCLVVRTSSEPQARLVGGRIGSMGLIADFREPVHVRAPSCLLLRPQACHTHRNLRKAAEIVASAFGDAADAMEVAYPMSAVAAE